MPIGRTIREQLPPRWLIAVVLMLTCTPAIAQSSAGGSVLRQIATLEDAVPGVSTWESLSMPETIDDRGATLAGFQQAESLPPPLEAQPELSWSSPHTMSQGEMLQEDSAGWYDFLPDGCLPWGPRTHKQHRHVGLCMPLEGTSWLNRPLSAGWGIGGLWPSRPLGSRVDLEGGIYGIYRVGWDYDYYWGLEARLGQATNAVHDNVVGTPDTTSDGTLFDVSLLWYPTGDSRLRPYFCAGLGLQRFNFRDDEFHVVSDNMFSMPIGVGAKYMLSPWMNLRVEFTDNIAFGSSEIDFMNNFALTAGVDIRFGGFRPSYWPWNPNRHIW